MDHHQPAATDDTLGEPTLTELAVARGTELNWEQLVEEARRRGPDPRFAGLSDDELEREVGRVAAVIAAQTARWLALLGELIVRGTWADQGFRTPGAWLSYRLGIAPATAREHARVALRLRDLPRVADRFAAGTLSYSKVRAIVRLALEEDEEVVLRWADHATAAQLESMVRGVGTARRLRDGGHLDGDDPRYGWSLRVHEDGTASLTLRGPAEEVTSAAECAELLAEQLAADRRGVAAGGADASEEPGGEADSGGAADDLGPTARTTGRVTSQDRVDAVGHVLAAAVASDVPVDTSGLDRTTYVLQFDAAEFAVPVAEGQDLVPVRDAGGRVRAMDRRALHRLACEASIVAAVRDEEGRTLDLGRRRRRTTAALRRAVHLRDRGCAFPGCGATRHLHVHHVRPWSKDGPTDLANLALLCAFHHRFVHDQDWRIEVVDDGRHRFTASDGQGPDEERWGASDAAASLAAVPDVADPEALAPPGPVDLRPFDLDTVIHILLQSGERRLAAAA